MGQRFMYFCSLPPVAWYARQSGDQDWTFTLRGIAEQWTALLASQEHCDHSQKQAVGCFWLLTDILDFY